MSLIVAESAAWYERVCEDLRALLMPDEAQEKNWKKLLEQKLGVRRASIDALFGVKGRNLQRKWTDAQMEAFNSGAPHPKDAAMLFATLAWKGSVGKLCKSSGVQLADFEREAFACIDMGQSWAENWERLELLAQQLAQARGPEAAEQAVRSAVRRQAAHFTAKLTHPAIAGVGIVLTPEEEDLPYLCAGSIRDVALDAISTSSPDATYSSCLQLRNRAQAGQALQQHEQLLVDAFNDELHKLGSGVGRISVLDYRLKQMRLPDPGGDYVAITPLACAGIAKSIAAIAEHIRATPIALPYGGSKPTNISLHREITTGYLFAVPSLNADSGYATHLSLCKRGFRLDCHRSSALWRAALVYVEWLADGTFVAGRDSALATKIDRHNPKLRAVVREALLQWFAKQAEVEAYLGSLPDEQREQAVDVLRAKGPIEKSIAAGRLDEAARQKLAKDIVETLDQVSGDKNTKKAVALDKRDLARLQQACDDILSGMTA